MVEESQDREQIIAEQVERLKSLPRGEEDRPWETLRSELFRVLMRYSHDEQHAERAVTAAVDNLQFAPAPSELIEILRATKRAQQPELELTETRCTNCGDSGFRQVVRVKNGTRYEFSEPCDCKKTETLAQC